TERPESGLRPSPTPSPRPQAPPRLPVPGLRPLPDSQSPASGPSPTPSPRPQAPPRLPVPGLRPLPDSQSPASGPSPTPSPPASGPSPDSQSPASGPSPTPSPRPQALPDSQSPGLRPLPDSQSPASGPSTTPSPRPQALPDSQSPASGPPRLPVPGLRPSPPPPALLLPLAALNQLLAAGAISFQLPSNARKCLREEIHKDRLVTDSSGHILYSKEEATKGKFAFTTDDYDMFEICFESRLPPGHFRVPDQLIILNTKHGVEAKNYEDIAKAEKLKPLEVELRRLEDLSESIVNDFADMKQREEEMRDTNGEDFQRETQTKDHVKI
ncbi:uncharacterized protein, partial [Heptranchias perlo]|uniref:uncharacterized protein n=1 Tax=Heptranchias perlo TaxID=212740 RepID=UPI00355A0FB6